MNQYLLKVGVFTALSVCIVSNYNTTMVDAAQAPEAQDVQLVFAEPHPGVLAMEEKVGQAEIEALTLKANGDEELLKKELGFVLSEENADTNKHLGLHVLPVPPTIMEQKKIHQSGLANINAFNDFYFGLSKSCKGSAEAKKITNTTRTRDAIHGFYAMAFGDPNGHNRYASYQSYGGWGDIHFSGPDGNEDLHGVAGKAMVLITSSDAQVNASTARWHGSPATVATGYYAQVRGADGALYKISMPMNQSVTVTKNGANVSLHGGRNILTKNLAIDMHAKNCTIYTSRFSFSNYDAREYKNLSMAVTGGACERGNCLGGFLGRKAARGLTGSPAGFREGINPYSSAFNVDSVWTTADSFQHTLFPVQDEAGGKTTLALVPGKTYMPVDQALAAGLFKRPNGQKAYKPSQVCGAGSSPADDVKPTDQGHAQQGPDHMGTPVKDALAH